MLYALEAGGPRVLGMAGGGMDRRPRRASAHSWRPGRDASDCRGQAQAQHEAAIADADVAAPRIEVLHADEYLAVVDKPAGLMAHASAMARGEDDFLVDRLREQFGKPVYLVHRLDRATSGCLLIAFDRETAGALGKIFMSREVSKDYLAVCRGWPEPELLLDYPLDGGPGKPEKKPAITALHAPGHGRDRARRARSTRLRATRCCVVRRRPAASARSAAT